MARTLPHTSFNRSRLVRVLAGLAVTEVAEAKQSLAERLGLWLDFTDAMALFSALGSRAGGTSASPLAGPASGPLQAELVRLRSALVDAITTDGVRKTGNVRIKLPTPAHNASVEDAADFSPYHRYYLAHQREMSASIAALRASARAALAGHSPDLKRLAALDEVLEQALASRERNLLATVPLFVGKRFEQLFAAHRAARRDTPLADAPECWLQPGGWLVAFYRDMQAVLLAELEVRLEPVAGLIAALGKEVTK
ncbi:MAG: hypothetical protein H6R15_178 [Proteobacteria bacterium]|nr:hypothetical protein [Pseudomonadota bacterium]